MYFPSKQAISSCSVPVQYLHFTLQSIPLSTSRYFQRVPFHIYNFDCESSIVNEAIRTTYFFYEEINTSNKTHIRLKHKIIYTFYAFSCFFEKFTHKHKKQIFSRTFIHLQAQHLRIKISRRKLFITSCTNYLFLSMYLSRSYSLHLVSTISRRNVICFLCFQA